MSLLDKKNIQTKVFVSGGFTSVVAALYAKYQNANRVNFKLFSLFPIIKEYKLNIDKKRPQSSIISNSYKITKYTIYVFQH